MQRLAVTIFVSEAAFVVVHLRGARVGEGLAFVCLVSISTTWRRRYCVLPTAQQISAAENEKGIGGRGGQASMEGETGAGAVITPGRRRGGRAGDGIVLCTQLLL